MKNIIYCSNAYEEIFNNNTRSNFNSYIDIHHIEYLHDGEIEAYKVTSKFIQFTNDSVFSCAKLRRKQTRHRSYIFRTF